MILKKLSIIFKINLLLAFVIAVSIFSYSLISNINSTITDIENTITIVERNNSLLSNILLFAEKVLIKKKDAKDNLQDISQIYNYTIPVLRNGGSPPGYSEDIRIPAADESTLAIISEIEKEWLTCKAKIEIIIEEPVYNIVRTNDNLKVKTLNVKNPRVFEAVVFINKNFETIFQKQKDLKQYYITKKQKHQIYNNVIFIIAILLYVVTLLVLRSLIKMKLMKPASRISSAMRQISEGSHIVIEKQPEYKEYNIIVEELNNISAQAKTISEFVVNLKNNKFDIKIEKYNKRNELESNLIQLRDKLKESQETEIKRQEEEKQSQWFIDGQAKFNEILRNSTSNLYVLSDNVIKNLVKFLNASIGGLFILNDNTLELTSSFAYDRKKFLTKTIPVGEGLIGMCALEQNTVWLNNIPKNYIEIESGLGESTPQSLLIIPLKTDNDLLGVIEISSFNKFQKHEVEFVENTARNIAATIETTKISERTTDLLSESQKKSEELAQRDNEMTLKIDELRKTQNEAIRKEAEMTGLIAAVDRTLLKAELTPRARIVSLNTLFTNKTNFHPEDIKNKNFIEVLDEESAKDFTKILNKVIEGEVIQINQNIVSKQGVEIPVIAQYTPIKNETGEVIRILFIGNDISHQKEVEDKNTKLLADTIEKAKLLANNEKRIQDNYNLLAISKEEAEEREFELNALLSAINSNLIKLEFNIKGDIEKFNYRFSGATQYTDEEINTSKINKFLPDEINENYSTIIKNLQKGETFSGVFSIRNKKSELLWWIISLIPVQNQKKEISKILFLANDITIQKNAEEKIKAQAVEKDKKYKEWLKKILNEKYFL